MNHTFTSVSLIACLAISTMASSQETIQYPYNPDVDNDEYISTSDLTGFLAQFGQDFQLAPVLVDGDELLTVLQFMQTQITSLQAQVASLEAAAIPGLVDYVSVDDLSHTVLISGANFQVVNGSESQLSENALGNIVVGYNPVDSVEQIDLRTGSHNLILGSGQTYLGSCNIIGGNGNQTNGDFGIVSGLTNEYSGYGGGMIGGSQNLSSLTYGATLGGKKNTLNSDGGAIVGGYNNEVRREQAVVVAGSNNWIGDDPGTNNRYGVICGGRPMTRLPVSRVDATPRRRWCLTREVFAEGVEPKFTTRKSRPKKTFKKASPKHRRRFRNPPRFQRRNFASCSAPPLVWWICQNQTPCSAKPRPGLRRVGRSAPRTRRRNALVTVRAVSPQNQKPIGGETK